MRQTIHIQANLCWLVAHDKRANMWVADCPLLKIVVEGETYSQLLESADACLQALFVDLVSTGEIGRFLHEHNWKVVGALPTKLPPRVRFDIPYEIQRRNAHDFAAVCS